MKRPRRGARVVRPVAAAAVVFVLGFGAHSNAATPKGCAKNFAHTPSSPAQAEGEPLVPTGGAARIEEILICRYLGAPVNGTPPGERPRLRWLASGVALERGRILDGLRSELDSLAPAREPKQSSTPCPYYEEGGFSITFRYLSGPAVTVKVRLETCFTTIIERNAEGAARYEPTRHLIRRLERLAPVSSQRSGRQ